MISFTAQFDGASHDQFDALCDNLNAEPADALEYLIELALGTYAQHVQKPGLALHSYNAYLKAPARTLNVTVDLGVSDV